jgi:hypothetical protein
MITLQHFLIATAKGDFWLYSVLAIYLGSFRMVEWLSYRFSLAEPGFWGMYLGGGLATAILIFFVRGTTSDRR